MSILDRLTAGQYENSLSPQTQFVCVVGGVAGGGRGHDTYQRNLIIENLCIIYVFKLNSYFNKSNVLYKSQRNAFI